MNDIIKVFDKEEQQEVSARELHEFLEIKDHFTQWSERMFEYGFLENIDYQAVHIFVRAKNGFGGTNKVDYALTLDCAKEIAMIQKNEKGKQARQYFIDCEKKYRALNAPKSLAEALRIAAERQKKIEEQQNNLIG